MGGEDRHGRGLGKRAMREAGMGARRAVLGSGSSPCELESSLKAATSASMVGRDDQGAAPCKAIQRCCMNALSFW